MTAPTKAERLAAAMKERAALYAKYQPEWVAFNAKSKAERDALYAKSQAEWVAFNRRISAIEAEP